MKMTCAGCIHHTVCGSICLDASDCKQYVPASQISALETEGKKLEREVERFKAEANRAHSEYREAVKYMAELDDALMKNNFVLAGRILERWYRRNDGA